MLFLATFLIPSLLSAGLAPVTGHTEPLCDEDLHAVLSERSHFSRSSEHRSFLPILQRALEASLPGSHQNTGPSPTFACAGI